MIDFIAYHHMIAQCADSVFRSLVDDFGHECHWRIGPHWQPTGATAGVLLDHRGFQPFVRKGAGAYRFLFHMSHDVADVHIYREDNLRDMDIVFVPGTRHLHAARQALGPAQAIEVIGWPKYDQLRIQNQFESLRRQLDALPARRTVLYAASCPNNWEWRDLFPGLAQAGVNVVIKNHIVVDDDQPFPVGHEELYTESLRSINAMEVEARDLHGFVVAPRKLNICTLFPYVDVLISDGSSALLEFLPFGLSIETGRTWKKRPAADDFEPEAGRLSSEVLVLRTAALAALLSSPGELADLIQTRKSARHADRVIDLVPDRSSGHYAAKLIDAYLQAHGDESRDETCAHDR